MGGRPYTRTSRPSETFHRIDRSGIKLSLDLRVGHIRDLEIEQQGHRFQLTHAAPWVDDPEVAADSSIAENLKYLSGDFFCAPFGRSDVEAGPPHGFPANSRWNLTESHVTTDREGVTAVYALERLVMGASLRKELTLRDRHPFVYERHVFSGGAGALPVANHAMIRFADRGRLSFSEKQYGFTSPAPPLGDPPMGRSRLAYPARFACLASVPMADGSTGDLTHYPLADAHEDLVVLVEAQGNRLGWAAAVLQKEGLVFLSMKDPEVLPITVLWFSNGGRDHAPWNGRHRGVLGIEEGRSFASRGHRASIEPNVLSQEGIATALELQPGSETSVATIIGGFPIPTGWTSVIAVKADATSLTVVGDTGTSVTLPFDGAFLTRRG